MLTRVTRNVLLKYIEYYITTCGESGSFFDIITGVEREQSEDGYKEWLAQEILQVLESIGLSLAEIMSVKDTVSIDKEIGKDEGEYYTPEVWCKEGRRYLKEMVGNQWGRAVIWDASCGTGNLMRTEDYPQDKLYLSTLRAEDVEIVKQAYPQATVFQKDFLAGIDYNEGNEFFSKDLPEGLKRALKQKEPIIFFMNPPYYQGRFTATDVGEYMVAGRYSASARDLAYQFFYRVLMIKEYYQLKEVYIAFYHPITMYLSNCTKELVEELNRQFDFEGGMLFNATNFDRTGRGVPWAVAFSMYASKKDREQTEPKQRFEFDVCEEEKGVVYRKGKRTLHIVEDVLTKGLEYNPEIPYIPLPNSTGGTPDSIGDALVHVPQNYVYFFSARSSLREGNRQGQWGMELPFIGGTIVTEEVFWDCVPQFVTYYVARCEHDALNSRQTLSMPDKSQEGYEQWLIDSLPLVLFSLKSMYISYRNLRYNGVPYKAMNRMFPLSAEEVQEIITDKILEADIKTHPAENQFILREIARVKQRFSPPARALYDYCMGIIRASLSIDVREKAGYTYGLGAWDAGISQIRTGLKGGFWSDEIEKTYSKLLKDLLQYLSHGVYDYGILESIVEEPEKEKAVSAESLFTESIVIPATAEQETSARGTKEEPTEQSEEKKDEIQVPACLKWLFA